MCKAVAGITWGLGCVISFGMLIVEARISGLICLICTLITGTLFWAIGRVVEELGQVNENLYTIGRALERDRGTGVDEVTIEGNEVPVQSMTPSVNGEWVCKKCQTKNKSSDMICKVCGKYR